MPELKSTEMFFPTLLWRFALEPGVRDLVNKRIMEVLTRLEPNIANLERGTSRQTDTDLHRVPELAPMVAEFRQAVSLVLEFLDVVYESVRITGCWANVNAPHTSHREHIHPNNYLSAVYYVQADEGANQFTIDAVQRGAIQPVGQAGRPPAFSGMAASLGRFQPQQPHPDQYQLQRDVRAFRGDHERAGLERYAQDGPAHQGRLLTGGPSCRPDRLSRLICDGTIAAGRRLMNGALRLGPPGATRSRRLAPRPLPCAPKGRGAGASGRGTARLPIFARP